jgi:hypothetical protein
MLRLWDRAKVSSREIQRGAAAALRAGTAQPSQLLEGMAKIGAEGTEGILAGLDWGLSDRATEFLVCQVHVPHPGGKCPGGSSLADCLLPPSHCCWRQCSKAANNCQRDLLKLLGKTCKLPPLCQADVVGWNAVSDEQTTFQAWFLLPHELLATLARETPGSSWTTLTDEQSGLAGRREQWLQRMNMVADPGDFAVLGPTSQPHARAELLLSHTAPQSHVRENGSNARPPGPCTRAGLWGDSAPYATRDSLEMLLFSCMSAPNYDPNTEMCRCWCTVFSKKFCCRCGCSGRHTWDSLFAPRPGRAMSARCPKSK